MIPQIITIFEKRREDLINLLEQRTHDLEVHEQHQVYGAIKEVEMFLELLDSVELSKW